jgi:hypothetical protein
VASDPLLTRYTAGMGKPNPEFWHTNLAVAIRTFGPRGLACASGLGSLQAGLCTRDPVGRARLKRKGILP